jgi:hypothetical protein
VRARQGLPAAQRLAPPIATARTVVLQMAEQPLTRGQPGADLPDRPGQAPQDPADVQVAGKEQRLKLLRLTSSAA